MSDAPEIKSVKFLDPLTSTECTFIPSTEPSKKLLKFNTAAFNTVRTTENRYWRISFSFYHEHFYLASLFHGFTV
jgi:hypothetical protein